MSIYRTSGIPVPMNNVVGNITPSNDNAAFKSEIRHVFESYNAEGVNLISHMGDVVSNPETRAEFEAAVLESFNDCTALMSPACQNDPFYSNYTGRAMRLMENSLNAIATESVMIGYSPIVSYLPFAIKKQWIDNIFKDIIMTEIPKSPVINMQYEKRFLIAHTASGKQEYPLPEALYDDAIMKDLISHSTGLALKETPIAIGLVKGLNLIHPDYVPGVIASDPEAELTPDLTVFKVIVKDSNDVEHEVYTPKIKADITTHALINGTVKYDVKDSNGDVIETITDELVGNFQFHAGKITVVSTTGAVTKICLRGKLANRFNRRSLGVERRVTPVTHVMPESGPRFNSAVSIEDASDALALQNIDMVADNINVMGSSLANFEDAEIKMYLANSFEEQESGATNKYLYNELTGADNKMTAKSTFDALPYDGYNGNVTEWMKDSREWFERMIGALKTKLRGQDVVIVAVANPNIIRFLQDGINWVFSNDTQISGVKLSYNFGIFTSAQDRVHVVTSMRVSEDEGIRFVVIPLSNELVTFKHYKYNMTIDRGYRDPVHSMLPNIMVTHRTLTFDVFPVQGVMNIENRGLTSPETLKR